MTSIYTDASVYKKIAVTTCFVLTADNFLGCKSFVHEDVTSTLQAELYGIRDGLEYVISSGKDKEPITVYCDSYPAVDLMKCKSIDLLPTQFRDLVQDTLKLCNGRNVNFMLIKGHQESHNPNKVVDLISNSVLRFIKSKQEENRL